MSLKKLVIPSKTPLQYNSAPTRRTSLDFFKGAAVFDEAHTAPGTQSIEVAEDLENRFRSGVNRTDMPKSWAFPDVGRRLGHIRMDLADELSSWRRNRGEPIYRK